MALACDLSLVSHAKHLTVFAELPQKLSHHLGYAAAYPYVDLVEYQTRRA